jgi:hypothetical protein
MIKKMVQPISKRKLAWETTEEEGKTAIDAQHVYEFFNNMNTRIETKGAREDQTSSSGQTWVFKLMSENNKKLMPIVASTLSKEDVLMSKQTYVASGLNA